MADGKRAARPDPGAQLEELNDQLARFLQHADQLLEDWSRFGASVRATVDQELGRVEQAVGEAGERATKAAALQLDKLASERIDRAVAEGVARVKTEADRIGRATPVVAPAPAAPHRAVIGGVVLANLLLLVLLVVVIVRGGGSGGRAAATTPDAAVEPVGAGPEVQRACATLVEGWQLEAAEVVLRAGLDACGADAEPVRAHLTQPPPAIDAGPIDAAPPDAKVRKPR